MCLGEVLVERERERETERGRVAEVVLVVVVVVAKVVDGRRKSLPREILSSMPYQLASFQRAQLR